MKNTIVAALLVLVLLFSLVVAQRTPAADEYKKTITAATIAVASDVVSNNLASLQKHVQQVNTLLQQKANLRELFTKFDANPEFKAFHQELTKDVFTIFEQVAEKALLAIPASVEVNYAQEFYIDGGFFMDDDNDPKHVVPIQAMADRILKKGGQVRKELDYKMYVMNGGSIDAFSKGGQLIIFDSGVVESLNEDQAAGIVAHELAHNELKHYLKYSINDNTAALLLEAIVSNATAGKDETKAAWKLLLDTVKLAFKRRCELEADEYGIFHAIAAGYNPAGLIQVLEDILKEGPFSMLSNDHPKLSERAAILKKIVKEVVAQAVGVVLHD